MLGQPLSESALATDEDYSCGPGQLLKQGASKGRLWCHACHVWDKCQLRLAFAQIRSRYQSTLNVHGLNQVQYAML